MSKKADHFRRMVRKIIEKSGGDLEVAMRRAEMCISDPAMEREFEVIVENTCKEVLAAEPDLSAEEVATKAQAIIKAKSEAAERYQQCGDFNIALACAAADAHPNWEVVDLVGGKLRHIGRRKGPRHPTKLIDWFCANYPERVDDLKLQLS